MMLSTLQPSACMAADMPDASRCPVAGRPSSCVSAAAAAASVTSRCPPTGRPSSCVCVVETSPSPLSSPEYVSLRTRLALPPVLPPSGSDTVLSASASTALSAAITKVASSERCGDAAPAGRAAARAACDDDSCCCRRLSSFSRRRHICLLRCDCSPRSSGLQHADSHA